jgi:hypothetical protein
MARSHCQQDDTLKANQDYAIGSVSMGITKPVYIFDIAGLLAELTAGSESARKGIDTATGAFMKTIFFRQASLVFALVLLLLIRGAAGTAKAGGPMCVDATLHFKNLSHFCPEERITVERVRWARAMACSRIGQNPRQSSSFRAPTLTCRIPRLPARQPHPTIGRV